MRVWLIGGFLLMASISIWRQIVDNSCYLPAPPVDIQKSREHYLQQSRSAIDAKDDPEGRLTYMTRLLQDPHNKKIPQGIEEMERVFAQRIPHVRRRVTSQKDARSNASDDWIPVGPNNVGGRTRALALDVLDEDIIIAGGVSGGMWKSEDRGVTWEKTTHPSSLHSVTAIVQDLRPGKENTWFYGTGEIVGNSASRGGAPYRGNGLFKSVDGGKLWSPVHSTVSNAPNYFNSQFQYVFRILPNKYNLLVDELYVAAVGAIFRSNNGGLSWEAVLGRDFRSHPFFDLNKSDLSRYTEVQLAPNGIYYAVMSYTGFQKNSPDSGVYSSSDGIHWQKITPRVWPLAFSRTVIGISASNPNVIYFLTDAVQPEIYKFEFEGIIGGHVTGKWTNLSANVPDFGGEVGDFNTQGSYDMVMEVHPADEDVVFLGGTNLYRSDDGFATAGNTHWIGGYDTTNDISIYPNHFVDQHALVFYSSDPDRMLSANDGGLYVAANNRSKNISWRSLNYGYRTGQFYTLAVDEYGSVKDVMGGLMDNGVYIAADPVKHASWDNLIGGDGAFCSITKNGAYYYASTQNGRTLRLTINKQLDYTTFTRVDPLGGDGYLFINPFVLAPENQNVMYMAAGDKLWRNTNLSQIPSYSNAPAKINWEPLEDTQIIFGQISALTASTLPAKRVYFGTSLGEVFKLDKASQKDAEVTNITSSIFPENAYVSCVAVDKRDSDHILVVFSNYNVMSIYASFDGGLQFTPVSGNLEEKPNGSGNGPSIRWVEIVPLTGGTNEYFVGTSTGLFSSKVLNGAATQWKREGPDEIGNVVVTMVKARTEDGVLYVATHGNGIYKMIIPEMEHVVPENTGEDLTIGPVYPNPFYDRTNISFIIPEDGMVRIRIFTVTGQLIRTLLWATQFAGENTVTWDGLNESGHPVNRGMYICNLEYADKALSEKILYLK